MVTHSSVQAPGAWLRDAIERRQTSQAALRGVLGVDKSLFSRYTRGEEQIPRPHLARLALELDPDAYEYALCLKDCEDFADVLRRTTAEFVAGVAAWTDGNVRAGRHSRGKVGRGAEEDLTTRISGALLTGARDILAQESAGDPAALARGWRRHLVDAIRAVNLVRRTVETAYAQPLLPPEAVPGFRYPINHYVGLVLDLDALVRSGTSHADAALQFRRRVLGNLRGTVWTRNTSPRPLGVLARQFTAHLLSRHGEEEDRDQIRESLLNGARGADPLQRRLSFTGLVLGHRDVEMADRFLWGLQRDRGLATANLLFNAFHYGDLALDMEAPFPRNVASFDRSIPHILRHLEQPERYRNILDAECVTLRQVLEAVGPRPFLRPAIRSRLRALLDGGAVGGLSQVKPSVRRQFVRTFAPLVRDGR